MKKYLFLSLACSLWACNLAETNLNPNDPLDVPVEVLLPPALEAAATEMAEDAAVYAGIFAQYFTGVDNQAAPVERYLLDESFNMNPLWQDFYTTPLLTFSRIIEKAEASQSPHYAGLARVMMAFTLGTVSSLWGDVPYREAFQGSAHPAPAFDPQAQVYAEVQALLDQAIEELAAPASVFSPEADDVIYQGDRERWREVAYALKARFYLHTVRRDPEAPAKALAALAQTFASPATEMVYPFGFTAAEQNPWFLYFRNTPYVQVDQDFVDLLTVQADPRRPRLVRRSFGLNRVGDHYAGEFATLPLVTYAETQFLLAEARLRTGQGDAGAALQAGIRAHVTEVLGDDITPDSLDAFVARVGRLSGDPAADLETIITQKYISHFTQIEGWTDYRRTGFPQLQPNPEGDNPQNPGGAIPRRFIYPQNERLFNANFPASNPNLQDRFWWDVE